MKSSKGRCVVTGCAGFIGSHLADKLIEEGYEVIGIDNLSSGKKENVNPKVDFYEFNITDIDQNMFKGVDYVFHLAAQPRPQVSIQDPVMSHDSNVTGTFNVLLEAHRAGVKKVIYASSSHAPYQNTPYALQKWMGEEYCRFFTKFYGLDTVILRYFNVYGERQIEEGPYATVIGKFLKAKREGKPLEVYGNPKRIFTYVKDVVENTMIGIILPHNEGHPYDFIMWPDYTIKQVAEVISDKVVYKKARRGEKNSILGMGSVMVTVVRLEDWLKTQ